MSKSVKRVTAALSEVGLNNVVIETGIARTAAQAAEALACETDQIAKSIIFKGEEDESLFLFITAGAQQVDMAKAQVLAGQTLGKANAGTIRKVTGFAIGGVSPVGHKTPIQAFFDPTLMQFDVVYAAAGTPNHVFECAPSRLLEITNATQSTFKA